MSTFMLIVRADIIQIFRDRKPCVSCLVAAVQKNHMRPILICLIRALEIGYPLVDCQTRPKVIKIADQDDKALGQITEYLDYIRTNDESREYTTELLHKTVEKVQEVRSDDKMEVSYM